MSLYLQDDWRFDSVFTLNYGLRYDTVSAFTDEHQWSPRLNLAYAATEATSLHAGVARYFTPPPQELASQQSINLYTGTTNQPEVPVSDPVKAERTTYYDIGASHKVNSALSLSADVYYKSISNLLDEGQFGQALILSPFNYEKGYARTTARDIAATSGVSLAAIGYHFGSMEALLNAAMIQAIEEWGQEIGSALAADVAAAPDAPPLERFAAIWGMDLGTSKCAVALYDLQKRSPVLCSPQEAPRFSGRLVDVQLLLDFHDVARVDLPPQGVADQHDIALMEVGPDVRLFEIRVHPRKW